MPNNVAAPAAPLPPLAASIAAVVARGERARITPTARMLDAADHGTALRREGDALLLRTASRLTRLATVRGAL